MIMGPVDEGATVEAVVMGEYDVIVESYVEGETKVRNGFGSRLKVGSVEIVMASGMSVVRACSGDDVDATPVDSGSVSAPAELGRYWVLRTVSVAVGNLGTRFANVIAVAVSSKREVAEATSWSWF